nr:immunoglobulin heavy chain junction region [Macaca mulatta]MOV58673.1 immunoglobulin heavy chain junction region [Macaca mulatta]MOV59445.1 immunoglobulin heavy chain junction region [Macaca mulatta]
CARGARSDYHDSYYYTRFDFW